jgi:3-dehydroquinate synthase
VQDFELEFRPPPRRTCRVRVGEGVLARLVADLIAGLPGRPLFLISDDQVHPLHGNPLALRIRDAGALVHELTFPAGEASKTRKTKSILEDRLFELGAGRDAVILAVGGGVTGDLAGFVAATWHRGIPVIQVPTTLLSMADAALGGKTAVNMPSGKNLVGSFHQPWGVYADTSVLSTLDEQFYIEGIAEIVKSAVIADAALFSWLEGAVEQLLSREAAALEHVLMACLAIKGRVVRRDELEGGRRAVLNFGHTVAHALESASGYTLRHGRAVAIGMCIESRLARSQTGFSRRQVARLARLLAQFGLPTQIPSGLSVDDVVAATYRDKKNRGGDVHYALPRQIGRMLPGNAVTVAIDESRLRGAIAELDAEG